MGKQRQKKVKIGVVTSNRMNKTIIVRTERIERHPRYGKYVRGWTRFWAHDEDNRAQIGDKVKIMETRPLSKKKRWRLVDIIEGGRAPIPTLQAATDLPQNASAVQEQSNTQVDV
jgi:small subunit ribosomal protein S17